MSRHTAWILAAVWLATMLSLPATATVDQQSGPAESKGTGAYSGGYFDDGYFDDDWYFDFYEIQSTTSPSSSSAESGDQGASMTARDYRAEQLYEDAKASGLFDS
ncbi:MAG TPA: hypothetical protein VJ746_08445 [Nitrospira sp.]|nr:hypothetical protein [Nitrospira sp.]